MQHLFNKRNLLGKNQCGGCFRRYVFFTRKVQLDIYFVWPNCCTRAASSRVLHDSLWSINRCLVRDLGYTNDKPLSNESTQMIGPYQMIISLFSSKVQPVRLIICACAVSCTSNRSDQIMPDSSEFRESLSTLIS